MSVISLSEIPKLKELLAPYGYTIHLHDACGGQSFTLEPVGIDRDSRVYEVIEEFFSSHRMTVTYYGDDKLNFVAR